jgi:hypothetical protein
MNPFFGAGGLKPSSVCFCKFAELQYSIAVAAWGAWIKIV